MLAVLLLLSKRTACSKLNPSKGLRHPGSCLNEQLSRTLSTTMWTTQCIKTVESTSNRKSPRFFISLYVLTQRPASTRASSGVPTYVYWSNAGPSDMLGGMRRKTKSFTALCNFYTVHLGVRFLAVPRFFRARSENSVKDWCEGASRGARCCSSCIPYWDFDRMSLVSNTKYQQIDASLRKSCPGSLQSQTTHHMASLNPWYTFVTPLHHQ